MDWASSTAGPAKPDPRAVMATYSWDEAGRLHLAHPSGTGTCIMSIPNAVEAVESHDPLTLRERVRCTRCGATGRVVGGWWIHD